MTFVSRNVKIQCHPTSSLSKRLENSYRNTLECAKRKQLHKAASCIGRCKRSMGTPVHPRPGLPVRNCWIRNPEPENQIPHDNKLYRAVGNCWVESWSRTVRLEGLGPVMDLLSCSMHIPEVWECSFIFTRALELVWNRFSNILGICFYYCLKSAMQIGKQKMWLVGVVVVVLAECSPLKRQRWFKDEH